MDCSLPGSFVHGIFQARVLEWVAISFFIEGKQKYMCFLYEKNDSVSTKLLHSKSKTHCDLFQVRLLTCSFTNSTNIYWACMMSQPGAGHGDTKTPVFPSWGGLAKRFKTYRKTRTRQICGSLSCYLMLGYHEFLRRWIKDIRRSALGFLWREWC